jgi:hypothetical protein
MILAGPECGLPVLTEALVCGFERADAGLAAVKDITARQDIASITRFMGSFLSGYSSPSNGINFPLFMIIYAGVSLGTYPILYTS